MIASELALVMPSIAGAFIGGAAASAADFALYPALAFLGRIDERRPGYGMRTLIPERMQSWMKAVEALPYFEKTYPPHWRT